MHWPPCCSISILYRSSCTFSSCCRIITMIERIRNFEANDSVLLVFLLFFLGKNNCLAYFLIHKIIFNH